MWTERDDRWQLRLCGMLAKWPGRSLVGLSREKRKEDFELHTGIIPNARC